MSVIATKHWHRLEDGRVQCDVPAWGRASCARAAQIPNGAERRGGDRLTPPSLLTVRSPATPLAPSRAASPPEHQPRRQQRAIGRWTRRESAPTPKAGLSILGTMRKLATSKTSFPRFFRRGTRDRSSQSPGLRGNRATRRSLSPLGEPRSRRALRRQGSNPLGGRADDRVRGQAIVGVGAGQRLLRRQRQSREARRREDQSDCPRLTAPGLSRFG